MDKDGNIINDENDDTENNIEILEVDNSIAKITGVEEEVTYSPAEETYSAAEETHSPQEST